MPDTYLIEMEKECGKKNSVLCSDQEVRVEVLEFQDENGEGAYLIKVAVEQTYLLTRGMILDSDRNIKELVIQKVEIY